MRMPVTDHTRTQWRKDKPRKRITAARRSADTNPLRQEQENPQILNTDHARGDGYTLLQGAFPVIFCKGMHMDLMVSFSARRQPIRTLLIVADDVIRSNFVIHHMRYSLAPFHVVNGTEQMVALLWQETV